MVRQAPRPWDEAYRRQGRLWRGERLDAPTRDALLHWPELRRARWLDLGCGDGKGLGPLAAALDVEAPIPLGLDASRWGLRQARAALTGAGRPPRLVQGDAARLSMRPAVFDAVRAVHVLGHLDDDTRRLAVREAARVLRPGGRMVVVEFGRQDFRHGHGVETQPHSFRRGAGIVTHYFDDGSLRALLEDAGLRTVRLDAERFTVNYHGVERLRERWWSWAERP